MTASAGHKALQDKRIASFISAGFVSKYPYRRNKTGIIALVKNIFSKHEVMRNAILTFLIYPLKYFLEDNNDKKR
jgi:hypothetical protein